MGIDRYYKTSRYLIDEGRSGKCVVTGLALVSRTRNALFRTREPKVSALFVGKGSDSALFCARVPAPYESGNYAHLFYLGRVRLVDLVTSAAKMRVADRD
jgi:hypothetical protein